MPGTITLRAFRARSVRPAVAGIARAPLLHLDRGEDERSDGDEHERGECVAPALEPLTADLIPAAGCGQCEPHDRADRDRGEDYERPDRGGDSDGRRSQKTGRIVRSGDAAAPKGIITAANR